MSSMWSMQTRTRNDAVVCVPQFIASPGTGAGIAVSQSGNCERPRPVN